MLEVSEILDWVAEVPAAVLGCPLSELDVAAVEETFSRYPVIVFRDQHLSASELAGFTRRLGELETPSNVSACHPDERDVLILSNEIRADGSAVGSINQGGEWHADQSHLERPSKATLLYAVTTPKQGGDTMFCNMFTVYENLRPATRERITGRWGIHHVSKSLNPRVQRDTALSATFGDNLVKAAQRDVQNSGRSFVLHPMVRQHPKNGRKSLFASPRFVIGIEDMDDAESQPLLDELFEASLDETAIYRHRWRVGDLAIWDNRWLNHRAAGGYADDDVRTMYRTVVCGEQSYAGRVFSRPA